MEMEMGVGGTKRKEIGEVKIKREGHEQEWITKITE